MTPVVREMTYRLDGYEFGTPWHDVLVTRGGFDPGAIEGRAQDVDKPADDGSWMGRDYLTGPETAFKLTVNTRSGADGMAALAQLAQVWRADSVRTTPGALSVLQYYRGGRWWRVYGRARKFAAAPKEFTREQVQLVDATFKAAAPFVEDDAWRSITRQMLVPPSGGGLVLPAVPPFELRPGSQARYGAIDVGGLSPAQFTVTVKGPTTGTLSNVRVSGDGWAIDVVRPIAYDETLYIDTRSQRVTVNGVSMPGAISARSRLDARLSPGPQSFGFEGSDPSGTATATLGWRDTYPI